MSRAFRVGHPLKLAFITVFLLFQVYLWTNYESIRAVLPTQSDKSVYFNEQHFTATPFEILIKKYGNDISKLAYHEKCQLYFKELYESDSSWTISHFDDQPYHKDIHERKDRFINDRIKNYKAKLREEEKGITDEKIDQIINEKNLHHLYEMEWQEAIGSTKKTEGRLIDSMAHLRVYGTCFLDQFGKFNPKSISNKDIQRLDDLCHDIETRAFQWLTKKLPVFTRWDGTIADGIPKMSDYIKQTDFGQFSRKHQDVFESCYMKKMRDQLNGNGIVVSASDKHLYDLIRLMANLRAIGNKLPVQIIHIGDFSEKSQRKLIKIARGSSKVNVDFIDELDHGVISRNVNLPDPDTKPEEYKEKIEELFPPQEVWFVNAQGAINPKYHKQFKGFGNKLIAYLFNSFQHTVLIDSDTAMVVDIEDKILGSPFYKDKGAYFFKDRELKTQNTHTNLKFFKSLMPSQMDTALFGIPKVTDFTLGNRFIGFRFYHYMESGLVAIDRARHFTGILSAIQILLWEPTTSSVWGDKELFWLGMSMAGDEDYYMNEWAAGAVGSLTPRERRLLDDETDERRSKLKGQELCSQHPGHLSPVDNQTLLWFNSGFSFCKFPELAHGDWSRSPYTKYLTETPEQLKEYYMAYQKIDSILIPKGQEFYANGDAIGESSRGWFMNDCCTGFVWCAYDKVGGRDLEESNGKIVKFTEDQKRMFNFIGSVYQFSEELFDPEGERVPKPVTYNE